MYAPNEALDPRRSERRGIHHRLSWFVTLQGLLFLGFVLIDKREHVTLTSLVVCAGVALCIPAIASTYARAGLQNWLRFVLALCWVAIGTIQFMWHAI
jgi:hypothetical protein